MQNADGLRPSTDRIRETLFNWLMHDIIDASVLDMFAGSGVLGIEALSRGAKEATFIENNKQTHEALKTNLATFRVSNARLIHGDAISQLSAMDTQFSLVFIDPPYNTGLVDKALEALTINKILSDGALIYVEHEPDVTIKLPIGMELRKQVRTNNIVANLLKYR